MTCPIPDCGQPSGTACTMTGCPGRISHGTASGAETGVPFMRPTMTDRHNHVRPPIVSKSDTSAALAQSWTRVSAKIGKGKLADAIRPLIPALTAVIADADRIKGAA